MLSSSVASKADLSVRDKNLILSSTSDALEINSLKNIYVCVDKVQDKLKAIKLLVLDFIN